MGTRFVVAAQLGVSPAETAVGSCQSVQIIALRGCGHSGAVNGNVIVPATASGKVISDCICELPRVGVPTACGAMVDEREQNGVFRGEPGGSLLHGVGVLRLRSRLLGTVQGDVPYNA